MAVPISRELIDFVLLGPVNDRRQLQDSPILGDVWLQFAATPDKAVELLIAPHREHAATDVAVALDERITRAGDADSPEIAPIHGIVAAKLTFYEVLTSLVPMTVWWQSARIERELDCYFVDGDGATALEPEYAIRLNRIATAILALARSNRFDGELSADLLPALDRFLALAGLILWAGDPEASAKDAVVDEAGLAHALKNVKVDRIVDKIIKLLDVYRGDGADKAPRLVYQISLNRAATPALERSVPAVKADAARRLFAVNCGNIAWAVLDSGIQGDHPAFRVSDNDSRVKQSFDFQNIRKIVSLDNHKPAMRERRVDDLLKAPLKNPPTRDDALKLLERLGDDARNRRSIHWDLVQQLIEIHPTHAPSSDHGTHVAGIIGASAAPKAAKSADPATTEGAAPAEPVAAAAPEAGPDPDAVDGVCPDIQLYDFRVLAPNLKETEFAIIAALQFIRHLNNRTDHALIHGANLSLSIPHNVRNFACGRTPICIECERLVDSGVVVVAAAGNRAYQSFQTADGPFEGYAAYSITDPGNADGVITVGATHRYAPHTYGVSFFSSRGPTGDGRLKPDLVAPGERIRGPFRQGWGDLDGTSMAAPHVSGAAAMLMARYTELVGAPRRIKTILCSSATDLGRERAFQGNGMLDVLRAFQSI